jgi:hypothetical protein
VSTDAPEQDAASAETGAGDPYYMYKPSMLGAAWEFALRPHGLEWRLGRHSGLLRYDRIRRVRLSFRPATMQSHRFLTEIWSADNPKITIASTSWRNLVEQARQDNAYSPFVIELHRRIAAAGANAQFTSGTPMPIYWLGAVVFVGIVAAMIALVVRSLLAKDWLGAALIAGLFALFGWQIGNFFRRNRPGRYDPNAVPVTVLPRGQA